MDFGMKKVDFCLAVEICNKQPKTIQMDCGKKQRIK